MAKGKDYRLWLPIRMYFPPNGFDHIPQRQRYRERERERQWHRHIQMRAYSMAMQCLTLRCGTKIESNRLIHSHTFAYNHTYNGSRCRTYESEKSSLRASATPNDIKYVYVSVVNIREKRTLALYSLSILVVVVVDFLSHFPRLCVCARPNIEHIFSCCACGCLLKMVT